MTTIQVRTITDGRITPKTTTFDVPFDEITPSMIMERLNSNIVGWTEVNPRDST